MDANDHDPGPLRPWWGEGSLETGRTLYRHIGATEIWLTREQQEWRFAMRHNPDERDSTVFADRRIATAEVPHLDVETRRLGLRETAAPFRFTPRLADRPVVIRPTQPIALPAHEELTLYFTSPLWLQVEVGHPLAPFAEVPLQRPSDTWFGPNTRVGETCYALRTSARLRLADLPRRPHRAVTELRVLNLADEPLELERLLIPLPMMSLYATRDGHLWTGTVTLERRDSDDQAELKLDRTPPTHAREPEVIGHPRAPAPRSHLFRAFGGLIGGN